MGKITQKLEEIIQDSFSDRNNDQFNSYEETMKKISSISSSKKPSYTLPLKDTLGKDTYNCLNSKKQ